MMSDVSQGEGWWMASDGRWYPPQDHPNNGAGSPSQVLVPDANGHSASADRSAVAAATARQCVNGHEMPESHVFCSVCGSGRSEVGPDFSAPQSGTRTGLAHKIGAFYGHKGRLTPMVRIILTAVIVVFVIGAIGVGAFGGSSSTGSSSSTSSGGSSASAPAQSPSDVCYSTLEGWASYDIANPSDTQSIVEEFGINSGIPVMVFSATGEAQSAAVQNGIQAGRDSLSSAITADCTTLLGQGDDPTTWPTAPSS
jgi:hypothetical protein